MAAITWANVTAFAASLTTVDVAAQAAILAHVNNVHDLALFKDGESDAQLYLMRILLAAHLGETTATSAGTSAGMVTSESAGGLSRSYAYPTLSSGDGLELSAWGRQYKNMVRSNGAMRTGFAF